MKIPEAIIRANIAPKIVSPSVAIEEFLAKQKRRLDNVRGDGNRLFRSLSKQLFGTDCWHVSLRMYISDVLIMNSDRYNVMFIPYQQTLIFSQHLKAIQKLGTWGSQVEIQAASDCFQIPIFVCSPHPQSQEIRLQAKAISKTTCFIMPPTSVPPTHYQ